MSCCANKGYFFEFNLGKVLNHRFPSEPQFVPTVHLARHTDAHSDALCARINILCAKTSV